MKELHTFILFISLNFLSCYGANVPVRLVPPATDAKNLYQAMEGIGTDEGKIIHIIGELANAQRQLVVKEYYKKYNRDLVEDLKSELSGNLNTLVKDLMREPDVFLAKEVKRVLTSVLPDDYSLAELLCTRSKSELLPIMNAFHKRYNKTLLDQMDESLEGDMKTFYKAIITEKIRESGSAVNTIEAQNQVDLIPNAADYCTVDQNQALMNLFAKASFDHIHFVEVNHQQVKGKSIEDQLKRWCNDDGLTKAYITVLRYSKDPVRYYAEELRKSMVGIYPLVEFGTNDNKLIRIIVSRSEIDLRSIKNKYNYMYNTTLSASIGEETSGDYRKLLQKIIDKSDIWSS